MGRIYGMPSSDRGTPNCARATVLAAAALMCAAACVTPPRYRGGLAGEAPERVGGRAGTTAAAGRIPSSPADTAGESVASATGDGGRMGPAPEAVVAMPGDPVAAPAPPDSGGLLPAPAGAPPAATVEWDIEVEAHAERTRVAYFADIFTGRLREAFQRALSRQTRYAGLIGTRLRSAGLPQDLIYLALIESYYDPHAYSRAAAVGMWQFMTRTARAVGLRVDWWVDERRDPVRSTEGAARHLLSLHDEFGSPFLAAAAYNGGSGRVSRGLAQFAARLEAAEGDDKFFALSATRALRPETRDYVPKLIAAALVAKQPERYGLTVDTMAPLAFDSVWVAAGAPLAAVALAAGVPVDSIRDLNPHLLRGMLPPGDAMWVRVPVGTGAGFDERYAALDSADRASVARVTSKKGESMVSIARRHGLTAKKLGWYNPRVARLKSGNLVAGQTILVPTRAVANAARDVPDPAIERYPRRTRNRPAARTAAAAARRPAATPAPKAATSKKR